MTAPGCDGHAALPAELRALVLTALDRVEPAVERLRTAAPVGEPAAPVCTACPVCALLAVLRGERSDLVVRLAEQAGGLLTALRAAVEASAEAPDVPTPEERTASGSPKPVQRITVQRAAGGARRC